MYHPNPHLSATGTGKPPPEKSKFLQTCNRLSQFLKDKGNLRDLKINAKFDARGIRLLDSVKSPNLPLMNHPNLTSQSDAAGLSETVDLLSTIDEKASKPADAAIPQYVILDSSSTGLEESVTEPKTAQMTIFYEGQVLVLDDVPADRARDLMLLIAKNGKSDNQVETPKPKTPPSYRSKEAVQVKDSDLPIARRASLHKFLAKRKDRATVRAPYQSPGCSSSGNDLSFDLNM